MKYSKIPTLFVLAFSTFCLAQTGIDTTTPSSSAILEFGEKGRVLVLPKVSQVDANSIAGTLIFNQQNAKIQVKNNTGWTDLTSAGAAVQPYSEPEIGEGAIINDGSIYSGGNPPGVLVLKSTSKGLLLPSVSNATALHLPVAGSICYDVNQEAIAIYNGTEWTFWN